MEKNPNLQSAFKTNIQPLTTSKSYLEKIEETKTLKEAALDVGVQKEEEKKKEIAEIAANYYHKRNCL